MSDLIDLVPELCENYSSFDQPLKIPHDQMVGKDHLLITEVGTRTGPLHVHLEQPVRAIPRRWCDANWEGEEGAFDQYREMYFEGSVSSAYFWDLDDGFVGVILINNAKSESWRPRASGTWSKSCRLLRRCLAGRLTTSTTAPACSGYRPTRPRVATSALVAWSRTRRKKHFVPFFLSMLTKY